MAARKKKSTVHVPAIHITVEMPFPPVRVFQALTDPKDIRAWSGSPGVVATRTGGPFRMWDGWNTGRVLARRPPTTLAYTWRKESWADVTNDSVVRWKLTRIPSGTRLSLVHSKLPSAWEYRDHKGGWPKYFLKPMAAYLKKQR